LITRFLSSTLGHDAEGDSGQPLATSALLPLLLSTVGMKS
jgi:hypothetical protein